MMNVEASILVQFGVFLWVGKFAQAQNLLSDLPALTNITVKHQNTTSLSISFAFPEPASYEDIGVSYQIEDPNTNWIAVDGNDVILDKLNRNGMVTLSNLETGALYRINLTALGHPNHNASSTLFLARTNPRFPTDIETISETQTIHTRWRAPVISSPTWKYNLNYHPIGLSNESVSLCIDNKNAVPQTSLTGLEPGKGYAIDITTVAGETCDETSNGSYVTYSAASPQLLVYTQPRYPTIKFWTQATLNAIKVCWTPPDENESDYDLFQVGVKQLQTSESFAAFENEEFLQNFPKGQNCAMLQLTQGASYRVNVTSVVGPDGYVQYSDVIPGTNSVQFRTWHRHYDHFPFSNLEWDFNTCGKSGRFGPSQLLCDGVYSNQNLKEMVDIKHGLQEWFVPMDGLYQITAAGAGYEGQGGLGAVVSGQFHLKEGAMLKIAVGQRGRSRSLENNEMLVGGSGGTFVFISNSDQEKELDMLLIAGGSGSAPFSQQRVPEADGRLDYQAGNGSVWGLDFGLGGFVDGKWNVSGLPGELGSSGGAGYTGIARNINLASEDDQSFPAVGLLPFSQNENTPENEQDVYLPLSGGRYQTSVGSFSEGGFGGGGCGYFSAAGGGGGFSGGGGGPMGGYSGGGGSFIKSTGGQEFGEMTNNQPGYAKVTVVGLPSSSPIPLTLYLVLSFIAGILLTLICGAGLYGVNKCADKYFQKVEFEKIKAAHRPHENRRKKELPEINTRQPRGLVLKNNDSFSEDEVSEIEGTYEVHKDQAGTSGLHLPYPEQQDSRSVSSMSSVSSMNTDIKKFAVDSSTGKLKYRGLNASYLNSSFTGFESSDSSDFEYGLERRRYSDNESFSHSPPPAASELASEQQKKEFRRKFNLFRQIAEQNQKSSQAPVTKPVFVASTVL